MLKAGLNGSGNQFSFLRGEATSEPTSETTTDEGAIATPETGSTDSQTLDASAVSDLLYMIEEEKLAGDVYEAFYDLYGEQIFENIAESEDSHFEALIAQAESLGIDVDEFVFEDAGTFVNPDLQALYDSLIADGSTSLTAALEVGVLIEETDLTDIAEAIDGVEGTALADTYENLLEGSMNHLDAFEGALVA